MADQAWYLGCTSAEVAGGAILVGDPGRVSLAAELMEEPRRLNEERGFTAVTGRRHGCPVTIRVFGMGGPAARGHR